MKRLSEKRALELLGETKSRFEDARRRVSDQIDRWAERAAFFRGYQYNMNYGNGFELEEPTTEAREVYNYIQAHVRAAVANRIKVFPNPEVPAASADPTAIARADATEKLVKSFMDDDVIDKEEVVRALTWAQIAGGAWLKIFWDPNAGKLVADQEGSLIEKKVTDPETGEDFYEYEEATDEFGEAIVSRKHEGAIKVEFVDTIDGIPDPHAKREQEMRYWFHRKNLTTSQLEMDFPKDYFGKSTKGRFSRESTENDTAVRDAVAGNPTVLGASQMSPGEERAQLVECWYPASTMYPNGLLVVWCGGVLIDLGPNMLHPARIPAVLMLGDNIVPSGLYADGAVENLIPLQRSLNRNESKLREWIDVAIVPRVLNPLGSMVDVELLSDVSGTVIDYTPGLKPTPMDVQPVPSSLFDYGTQIVNRMKEISSYSDISRGDVPQGIQSGRAIAFLRENEQTIREPDIVIHKKAMLMVLKQCLMVAREFYTEDKIVRTLGPEGWESKAFKDEDYDWGIDLAPEPFSGAPNSRALRWAETMEAFQAGLYNDTLPGAKEARRALGMDHAGRSTVDFVKQHRNMARFENDMAIRLSKGEPVTMPPVEEWYDDEVHLEEHDPIRNSPSFLQWPEQARMEFLSHCEIHAMNMQLKMGGFAEQQNMLGGAPGPEAEAPGVESPLDGGNGVTPTPPESQDEFMQGAVESGIHPG